MFKVNDKDTRKRKVNDEVKNKDTVDVYTGREGGLIFGMITGLHISGTYIWGGGLTCGGRDVLTGFYGNSVQKNIS